MCNESRLIFSLFRGVAEAALQKGTTYRAFDRLSGYFDADTSVTESNSAGKQQAINDFLSAVTKTKVMKKLREFLAKYSEIPRSVVHF